MPVAARLLLCLSVSAQAGAGREDDSMRMVGIVLIVLGLAGVLYGGFSWTRQKTVLDAGPITVKTDKHESLPIPPIVGLVCVVGGIALMVTSKP